MPENKFENLKRVVEELREKCPWDKKQTIKSLRALTIEEVYELSDAIISEDNINPVSYTHLTLPTILLV